MPVKGGAKTQRRIIRRQLETSPIQQSICRDFPGKSGYEDGTPVAAVAVYQRVRS